MIGQTEALFYQLIEDAMAKAPTKALKGIPIGGSFEAIAEKLKEANAARSKREQQRAFGLHKPGKIATEALSLGQS